MALLSYVRPSFTVSSFATYMKILYVSQGHPTRFSYRVGCKLLLIIDIRPHLATGTELGKDKDITHNYNNQRIKRKGTCVTSSTHQGRPLQHVNLTCTVCTQLCRAGSSVSSVGPHQSRAQWSFLPYHQINDLPWQVKCPPWLVSPTHNS